MKRIDSQGKSLLSFPDELRITHRWQTIGLIVAPEENNPTVLNYFRVFISANTKEKVRNFVDYLIQKKAQSEEARAIQIVVRKLNEIAPDDQLNFEGQESYKEEEIQEKFGQAESDPDFLTQIGEINIGIDRVHMNTLGPCEILYTIDPTWVNLPKDDKYSTQFSADNPSVSCEVMEGGVRMEMYELSSWQTWILREMREVYAGFPQTTQRIPKIYTGIWQVVFTGLRPNSEFNFSYSRLLP